MCDQPAPHAAPLLIFAWVACCLDGALAAAAQRVPLLLALRNVLSVLIDCIGPVTRDPDLDS
jgi:hypothetical protein